MSAPPPRTGPEHRYSRVVHLTAEYGPWARTGGLAEAVHGLATSLADSGVPTSVVMPLYRQVRESGPDLTPVGGPVVIRLGAGEERVRVFRLRDPGARAPVYLIDHPECFDRAGIYGEGGTDYPDNARRFGLLSAAATQLLPDLFPDAAVLHAHDWHAALAPILARTRHAGSRFYQRLGTVLSVHNAGFQGRFSLESLGDLGLPELLDPALESYGAASWLKGGLAFSDAVTTVSPTHAHELRTQMGGFGLHAEFEALGDRLVGILNGIDDREWDPETDRFIPARYSLGAVGGKAECKRAAQADYRLSLESQTPLIVMIARLVEQKGLRLVVESLPFLSQRAQMVFLGQGDPSYQRALAAFAAQSSGRVAVDFDFRIPAEHRLLAGADLLLMPSLYEPCGLTQMRALRYGTLPVARRVGGLADTIEDNVTGFLFDEYSAAGLQGAVERALAGISGKRAAGMIAAAMARDFSWWRSTPHYADVYRNVVRRRLTLLRPEQRRGSRPRVPAAARAVTLTEAPESGLRVRAGRG